MKRALSLVITTRDNAASIGECIRSASFADEVVVLDSFSDDATVATARGLGARVVQEEFRGYGPQKQRAIDLAAHDLVLLLDADEELSAPLASEIQAVQHRNDGPPAYRLQREEWLYWKWPRPGTRLTDHLRLFDRRCVRMGEHPVHAAAELIGEARSEPCPVLKGRLRHFGHADLSGQVDRINHYTTGSLEWSRQRPSSVPRLKLLFAPPAAFFREFIVRRQFLNGWAGFIASRMAAWHAFLRHAKQWEDRQQKPNG